MRINVRRPAVASCLCLCERYIAAVIAVLQWDEVVGIKVLAFLYRMQWKSTGTAKPFCGPRCPSLRRTGRADLHDSAAEVSYRYERDRRG